MLQLMHCLLHNYACEIFDLPELMDRSTLDKQGAIAFYSKSLEPESFFMKHVMASLLR